MTDAQHFQDNGEPEEMELYGNDTIICPFCGKDNGHVEAEDYPNGEQDCFKCGKTFEWEANFSVDFETRKPSARSSPTE